MTLNDLLHPAICDQGKWLKLIKIQNKTLKIEPTNKALKIKNWLKSTKS